MKNSHIYAILIKRESLTNRDLKKENAIMAKQNNYDHPVISKGCKGIREKEGQNDGR